MVQIFVSSIVVAMFVSTSVAAQNAPPPAPAQVAPAQAHEQFVEVGIDMLSSPFTKPTVLKLNAIVAKSKMIIDRFDAMIPSIRSAVAAGAASGATPTARQSAKAAIGDLELLSARANANLADMKHAEHETRTSGEQYNDTILSAMVEFVVNVDDELKTELRETKAKMQS